MQVARARVVRSSACVPVRACGARSCRAVRARAVRCALVLCALVPCGAACTCLPPRVYTVQSHELVVHWHVRRACGCGACACGAFPPRAYSVQSHHERVVLMPVARARACSVWCVRACGACACGANACVPCVCMRVCVCACDACVRARAYACEHAFLCVLAVCVRVRACACVHVRVRAIHGICACLACVGVRRVNSRAFVCARVLAVHACVVQAAGEHCTVACTCGFACVFVRCMECVRVWNA